MVRGRVVLPKVDQLPPAEEDLQELLHRFSEAVARGEPLNFATFKRLWKEMSISFIFETRLAAETHEYFVSSLYASALDCLEVPLMPRKRPRHDQSQGRDARSKSAGDGAGSSQLRQGEQRDGEWGNGAAETGAAHGLSLADLMGSAMGDDSSQSDEDSDAEHLSRVQISLGRPTAKQKSPVPKRKPAAKGKQKGAAGGIGRGEQATSKDQQKLLSSCLDDLPELSIASGHLLEDDASLQGPNQEGEAHPPDPLVVQIGAVYLLYGLYEAQPPTHNIRIYVPLHLLRQLTWVARMSAEVHALLGRLLARNALLVGAVRRPVSGTTEARVAGHATKDLLKPDRLEQQRAIGRAFSNLSSSLASWNSLQHIQLLCNSYWQCQERLWAGQPLDVQGLFSLDTGSRLGGIARQMQAQANQLWAENGCPQTLQPVIEEGGGTQDEEGAAQSERSGPARATMLGQDPKRPPLAPADAAKAREAAAARRRQRISLAEEGEDGMPSMEDLGLGLTGAVPQASESEVQQPVTSHQKGVRLVLEAQQSEAQEERRRLDVWTKAITGLLNEEKEKDPELWATGASRPCPQPLPEMADPRPPHATPVGVGGNPSTASKIRGSQAPASVPRTRAQKSSQTQASAPANAAAVETLPNLGGPVDDVRVAAPGGFALGASRGTGKGAGAKRKDNEGGANGQSEGAKESKRRRGSKPEAKKAPDVAPPSEVPPNVWSPSSHATAAGKQKAAAQKPTQGAAKGSGGDQANAGGRAFIAGSGGKTGKAHDVRGELPEVAVEEPLEQNSAQTTQGKAQIEDGGRNAKNNRAQEPQSKGAAENLADCLAEIDEFLKDA